MAFVNYYFDQEDFEQPVKPFIDDSLFFDLEATRIKRTNFYVMKSEVQLQDAYLQLGQINSLEFV